MSSKGSVSFEAGCRVRHRSAEGEWGECSLAELQELDCETFLPVRRPAFYRRQRNMPGWFWCESTGDFVYYESLLERAILTLLDFDSDVEAVAAQPFELRLPAGGRRRVRHVPDFFVLRRFGRPELVDVSPERLLGRPERAESFTLTERACDVLDWSYTVMTEPDRVLLANVQTLAGSRREPRACEELAGAILDACASPRPLGEVCASVDPLRARPVMLHLLWKRVLEVDLTRPLRDTTLVRRSEPGRVR